MMKSRRLALAAILAALLALFAAGAWFARQHAQQAQDSTAAAEAARLVRAHSPVLGRADAPVTVVEFFDPACESCRAFHPFVKALLARHPQHVRVVVRYAPFHQGSEQVVRLLEAARLQDKYLPVLEALLQAQPEWADHARPDVDRTYAIAQQAGLDLARARQDMQAPALQALLAQDVEDLRALKVRGTPTFFVNGRSLPSFGPGPLAELVDEEVAKARP